MRIVCFKDSWKSRHKGPIGLPIEGKKHKADNKAPTRQNPDHQMLLNHQASSLAYRLAFPVLVHDDWMKVDEEFSTHA